MISYEKDKIYKTDPGKVIVSEGRRRKHFDRISSLSLENSIKEIGQFVPGICSRNEQGVLVLVAGERRLRSCISLGIDFKYSLLEEVDDPLVLEEIELEENIQRDNFTWQEEVEAKERLHVIKQKRYGITQPGQRGGHTIENTATQLGETKGLVSQDIELAYWAKNVPEVQHARNKSEAKKIVKRFKEALRRQDALKEAQEGKGESACKEGVVQTPEGLLRDFAKRALLGEFPSVLPRCANEQSFDVVIFDPPWGVALEVVTKGREGEGSTQGYEDSPEQFINLIRGWLEALYERMSTDSHLYLFFGIIYHELIYQTLESVGFTTNRMPLFWHKVGAHTTRTPEVWPGRCYEAIAYARKGNKSLAKRGAPDIICTPLVGSKLRGSHPSTKHPSLYVELLERSCAPGDRVLDPMSGSGMFGVACEHLSLTHSLDWWMIEKDKTFRNLGLYNLLQGYDKLLGVVGEEQKILPETPPKEKYDKWAGELTSEQSARLEVGFKKLEPGTNDWKAYWKANPEEQEEMLAWVRREKD